MANPKKKEIVDLLTKAYWAEIETVMNYLANSVHLDGVRAEEIKAALAEDVTEELGHAKRLAGRLKVLDAPIPGSQDFQPGQASAQPPADTTDVVGVIRGVIDAENAAIETYNEIIQVTDGVDYVTQDLAIALLTDEEEHRRTFLGYLAEYDKEEYDRAVAAKAA